MDQTPSNGAIRNLHVVLQEPERIALDALRKASGRSGSEIVRDLLISAAVKNRLMKQPATPTRRALVMP